jgi:prevent-host-death family protein
MKTATAKDLRIRTSAILENVRKGTQIVITKRGKSIAVLKPFKEIEKQFIDTGFGLWKDRKDFKDVKAWIKERRKERYQR